VVPVNPRRCHLARAIVVITCMIAAACGIGTVAVVDESAVPPTPTPAPTPTPDPDSLPRLGPGGQPYPTPVPPSRPELVDPTAEVADVFAVDVPLLFGPEEPRPLGGPTDPIRVAGVVTQMIGPSVVAADLCAGARARFERANRDGELARPIQYIDCFDDEGDIDMNAELLAEAIDFFDVFAIVPATSTAFFSDELLAQNRVPHIGVGNLPAYCGFENSFGFGQSGAIGCPALSATATPIVSTPILGLWSQGTESPLVGARVAIARSDTVAGDLLAASLTLEAELTGAEVVFDSTEVPPASAAERTDWADLADQISDEDPDMVLIDGDRTAGLYTALGDAGFEGDVVGTAYVDAERIEADTDLRVALSGSLQVIQGSDPSNKQGDAWGRLLLDMAAIDVGSDDIGLDVLNGYAAADMFVAALSDTPEPLSAEAFHDTINNGWQYPGISGLVCGGWWPVSHVVPYPCGALMTVSPFEEPLRTVVGLTDFPLVVETPVESFDDED